MPGTHITSQAQWQVPIILGLGRQRQGDPGTHGPASQNESVSFRFNERSLSQIKWRGVEEDIRHWALPSTHTLTHAHTQHTHSHASQHTQLLDTPPHSVESWASTDGPVASSEVHLAPRSHCFLEVLAFAQMLSIENSFLYINFLSLSLEPLPRASENFQSSM